MSSQVVRGMRAPHEDPGAIYSQMQQELLRPLQWQNPEHDKRSRQIMIAKIHHLVRQRKPDADQDWLKRLPDMAKRLEDALYRNANNLTEYEDEHTLKVRLHQIALEIKNVNGSTSAVARPMPASVLPLVVPQTYTADYPSRPSPAPAQTMQQSSLPPSPQVMPPTPSSSSAFSATPFSSGGQATPFSSGGQATPFSQQGSFPADFFNADNATQAVPSSPAPSNFVSGGGGGSRPTHGDVLRQQQQRLLLLRHASKCPTAAGENCPATVHCAPMKALWKHIAGCKDQQCPTAHCVSSRFVLAHYHKCADEKCGVCEPVRMAIRKNSESRPGVNAALPSSSAAPPVPQSPSGNTPDLIPKYITLWRTISSNAAIAREKHSKLEEAKADVVQKDADVKSVVEEERVHNLQEYQDELWESKSKVLRMRLETFQQAYKTAQMQCMLLETEVHQMRQMHEKNLEYELQLQLEFNSVYPGDSGKSAIMQARTEAKNGMHQQQQIYSASTPKMSGGAVPVAKVDAQQLINQHVLKKGKGAAASKEAKEPKAKKPRKPASTSSSNQPSPSACQPYRPPPSPKTGGGKKMTDPKKVQHIVPMFRECPTFSPMIFETSLINTFNRVHIQSHIKFLGEFARNTEMHSRAPKFREMCHSLLRKVSEADVEHIFAAPVDPIKDGAPNYFDIVKFPMDFYTIREQIESNSYGGDFKLFLADMRRVFSNCLLYNHPGTIYYTLGLRCGQLLEREYAKSVEQEEERGWQARYNVNFCSLCFGNKLLLEPIVYFCSGPCGKRIPKVSPVYSSTDNRHYCNACVTGELQNEITLQDGSVILKRELKKDKHPESQEEGFVCCCSCKRWMHQACAMLNTKRGQDSAKDDFLCPNCMLQLADSQPKLGETYRKKCTARDLPETEFSKFVEAHLLSHVEKMRVEHVKDKSPSLLGSQFEEAKSLCVRVVMSRDAEVWTREGMQKMYPDFPQSFNSKQKALLLFEKMDGVDVLLFVMFLQEYGSECPQPNTRCVYLAYLDSVNFFRPAVCRTSVYHELIISTIDFERSRGFTRFFIWACPPVSGDDYIFHVHPKLQRTPKPDRLRMWYFSLLEMARQRGVVVSLTNFFDDYFSRLSELKHVPYFGGDCWTGFAELYLAEMEQKGTDYNALVPRAEVVQKALSRKQNWEKLLAASELGKRQMSSAKRSRKKSVPDVEVEEASQNSPPPEETAMSSLLYCPPPKPLESVPMQSAITWRISSEIEGMRDDFIVVKMYHDCVQCGTPQDFPGATFWVPIQYSPELDVHDYKKKRYAPPYCLCHECYQQAYVAEFGKPLKDVELPAFPPPEWKEEYEVFLAEKKVEEKDEMEEEEEEERPKRRSSRKSPPPFPPAPPSSSKRSRKRKLEESEDKEETEDLSGIEVLEFGKNAKPTNPYGSIPPCSLADFRVEVANIRPRTHDADPLMECPIFNVREDFLDLCKGNKYQFDDLRRAKHSTAMVLFHLHNPDSDSFVRSCNNCQQDIQGTRFACNTCGDYDLCESCYRVVEHPHTMEKHPSMPAKAVPVSPEAANSVATSTTSSLNSADLEAQKEKVREVTQQIVKFLPHASTCSVDCGSPVCSRTKKLLTHLSSCPTTIKNGCKSCHKGWYIISYHSRICRLPTGQCKVLECDSFKERSRANTNQSSDRRVLALMQRQTQQQQLAQSTEEAAASTPPVAPAEPPAPHPPLPRYNSQNLGGKGMRPQE